VVVSAERAVLLAIQAAGRFDDEWESRVAQVLPMVAGMLREQAEGMKVANEVLNAQVIFGEYRDKRLEESSQRIVVTFMADNGDRPEEARTHRIDEPAGKAMYLRLMSLQPGDRCAFFKATDTLGPLSKVRLLVNFERQPNKNAAVATPPQRQPRRTGAVRPAEEPPQPSAAAPAPNTTRATVLRAALANQPEEKRLKAIAMLKARGWEGADDIPEADFEKALYIARHQKEDWFD
jgi:hypothetical protein